ncbi:MAG: hypothetical protein AB4062_19760 [Crocosphaera sp.]
MAAFNPGITSSLSSTTLEGAVIEASLLLQNHELTSVEDTPPNNIAVNYFTGDNTCQITATLPIAMSQNSNGEIVVTAVDYFPFPGYNVGDSPDFQAASLPGAVLELFQKLQSQEIAQNTNNNVTITYDSETLIATITSNTLPISFAVNAAGKSEVTAVEYV